MLQIFLHCFLCLLIKFYVLLNLSPEFIVQGSYIVILKLQALICYGHSALRSSYIFFAQLDQPRELVMFDLEDVHKP